MPSVCPLIICGVSFVSFFNLDPWLLSLKVMALYCSTPEDNMGLFHLLFWLLHCALSVHQNLSLTLNVPYSSVSDLLAVISLLPEHHSECQRLCRLFVSFRSLLCDRMKCAADLVNASQTVPGILHAARAPVTDSRHVPSDPRLGLVKIHLCLTQT